jgi:hypothetical protein
MTLAQSSLPFLDLKGDLSEIEVICVWGTGDGAVYRQLRSWLNQQESHFLVFLEEDEEHFLKTKEAKWTKDLKVRLLYYQEGDEEIFKEIAWEFLFLKFGFYTVEKKVEKVIEVFSKIEYYHRGVDLVASDVQDMGVAVLKNVMGNQKKLVSSLLGQSLEGMCRQVPAIICGAGPSLNHQIPLLAALQDKAMVFAGGSAVTALTKQGVTPHLCAHFDPDPPRQRFLQQDVAEIPHFYQSRFSSALLDFVHAPLLWIAEGGNYPIEKWLREKYGIPHPTFDGGWTVANFCTAVAVLLGCNPIIFVGMEFSCPPDQVYAAGMQADEQRGFIQVQNSEGKPLLTKNDWLMSAEWLGALTQKHPQTRFLNAASQGLNVPHVERCSLDEASKSYLQRQFDLSGIIHALLQRAQGTGIQEADALEAVDLLKQSYARSDLATDQLLGQWEKHYPKSPMETGEYAVTLHDLEKEVAFQMVLDPLWQVWKRPVLRTSNHPLGQHLHRLLFFKRAIEANLRAIS